MKKAEGPECPGCGSKLGTLIESGPRWGVFSKSYRCDHCGRVFTKRKRRRRKRGSTNDAPPDLDAVVSYDPKPVKCRCPACGLANPPVKSTQKNGIRFHKCECGHSFQSTEAENLGDETT